VGWVPLHPSYRPTPVRPVTLNAGFRADDAAGLRRRNVSDVGRVFSDPPRAGSERTRPTPVN
jgi:hypothetical protein